MPPVIENHKYIKDDEVAHASWAKTILISGLVVILFCIGVILGMYAQATFFTVDTAPSFIAQTTPEDIPVRPYEAFVSQDGSTLIAKSTDTEQLITLTTVPGGYVVAENFEWLSDTELVYEIKAEYSDNQEKRVIDIHKLQNTIGPDYSEWLSDNEFYWVEWEEVSDEDINKLPSVNQLIGESLYVNPVTSELAKDICLFIDGQENCEKQVLPGKYFVATTTVDFVDYDGGYVFKDKARNIMNNRGYVEIGGSDGLPGREHRFYQKVNRNIGQTVAVLDMFISDDIPGSVNFTESGSREFWFFFSDPYYFDESGAPVELID